MPCRTTFLSSCPCQFSSWKFIIYPSVSPGIMAFSSASIAHVNQWSQCGTPGSVSTPRVSPKLCIGKKKNVTLYIYTLTFFCVWNSLFFLGSQLQSQCNRASQWVFSPTGNVPHQQDVPECPSPTAKAPLSSPWDLAKPSPCFTAMNVLEGSSLCFYFWNVIYLYICICMWARTHGGVWRHFQGFIVSFYSMVPRDHSQVLRLAARAISLAHRKLLDV